MEHHGIETAPAPAPVPVPVVLQLAIQVDGLDAGQRRYRIDLLRRRDTRDELEILELHHAGAEVEHRVRDGGACRHGLIVVDDDFERRGRRRTRERRRERRIEHAGLKLEARPRGRRDLTRRFARGREQQGCGENQSSHQSSSCLTA